MLIPNHPDDERLSALASGDPEAIADSALSEHIASCVRCTETVAELGALRASLAELPDLQPHRPLRLLPPVDEPAPSRVDAVGGWARRFFAPMLTAGAALALVGLVGTTVPILGNGASGAAAQSEAATVNSADREQAEATDDANVNAPEAAGAGAAATDEPEEMLPLRSEDGAAPQAYNGGDAGSFTPTDDRPIWPMLLFAGIAIMIAAALLRWILAPRAG